VGFLLISHLQRLAEVDQEVSAVAKFTALYIRAQLVFSNCLRSTSWTQLTQNSQNDSLKLQIQSFLQLCLKMHYCFSGLSVQENAVILQLKLRALAFQLVYIVRGSNQSALASCQYLLEQAEGVQKYLEVNGNLPTDDFTAAMFQVFDSLEDPKPGTVAKLLLPLFEKHPIPLVSFSSSVIFQLNQYLINEE
jgi:integrator complex subunit 4